MWRQSVWSSVISASIAATYLKEGGLITLTGANAALQETPGIKVELKVDLYFLSLCSVLNLFS